MFLANPLSAQSVWTIPGTVNASGQNNTRFVSDLTVTNPGTAATQISVSFIPSSTPNAKTVALSAGETIVYRNVVDSLFGATGAGALSISSDQPILVRARTYNTASSGTYGVSLPVYEADRLLGAGEVGDSLWVSQDASGNSGYRTNVAVVFPDETGGAATVTVYDADGNQIGQKDFSLETAGLQQFSVGSFAGAVSVGRAQIHVTRGRAAGYSVVVDNVTGDSSLFTFEDLPGGRQDVLINGVARANGRNGTFFRTDGRFYNPTDTDATVQVVFHSNGNANPSPATASFVLPAGKIRDVVDVLDALVGLPVGSSGALRFKSDWPVAILCRTSNVDPSGGRPGTFGAQQKPVPILSFLTSADAGASITGIRQDSGYRTNVGLAAGEDGARYTLTLTSPAGGVVGTASGSLGPWGWTQPSVQDLFRSISIPSDATLLVRVTEGSLDVYDSSIDNLSGDSVVTPIATLPAAIPASATIGPAGGSIRSSDGRLTLRVPAGALSQPVTLSFQQTTNNAPQGTGPGYQLLPSGITFARPAHLTLAYGRAETEGSSAEALTLAVTEGSGWYAIGGGSVDPGRQTLTVPLDATAPSLPAAASPRTILAPGPNYFAVIRSWEFYPSGRRVVTGYERVRFSVNFVGYSSSFFNQGRVFLSSSPNEVEVSYWVNGASPGVHPEEGTIAVEGLTAVYTAPRCPPRRNPVLIYATIANRGVLAPPYRPRGNAHVRVVSREWRLTVDPSFTVSCSQNPFEASDVVTWDGPLEVDFRLDDDLFLDGSTFVLAKPKSHDWQGCRKCADQSTSTVENRGADSPLRVTLQARWNPEADAMTLDLWVAYDGLENLWTICKAGKPESLVLRNQFNIYDRDVVQPGQRWTWTPTGGVGDVEVHLRLQDICR